MFSAEIYPHDSIGYCLYTRPGSCKYLLCPPYLVSPGQGWCGVSSMLLTGICLKMSL